MSLDTEIREAFERHAIDARPRPDTWAVIEHRISHRHRMRMIGSALGTAAAIIALAVVTPRLVERRVELPTTPAGWTTVRPTDGGFELSYPPDWVADAFDRGVRIIPPRPLGAEPKRIFGLNANLSDAPYDNPLVTSNGTRSQGEVNGHAYVRYELVTGLKGSPSHQIVYLLPWEGPPVRCQQNAPCPQPSYELQITVTATFAEDWRSFSTVAERIVRTLQVVLSEAPPPVPTLQAKIKVQASFLTAGPDAIWAITQRSGGEGAFLSKIDPATNRVVGTVDLGLAPVGVAADDTAVWVANGSGCAIAYGCSQGGEAPPPTPQFPQEESVWRIDPATLRIEAKIRVPGPSAIAAGDEGVWVASYGPEEGSSVVRSIDPRSNAIGRTVTIDGDNPKSLATGAGRVWVTTQAPGSDGDTGIFSAIDPAAGRVVATSEFGSAMNSGDVAAGEGAAWVTSGHAVLKTDATGKIDLVIAVDDPAPIALGYVSAGEGSAWVLGGRGQLFKIDPQENSVVGDAPAIGDNPPVGANDVVTGFGSVWVASGDGQIWRMSP